MLDSRPKYPQSAIRSKSLGEQADPSYCKLYSWKVLPACSHLESVVITGVQRFTKNWNLHRRKRRRNPNKTDRLLPGGHYSGVAGTAMTTSSISPEQKAEGASYGKVTSAKMVSSEPFAFRAQTQTWPTISRNGDRLAFVSLVPIKH